MANLKDYTKQGEIKKATNQDLGLVKGGKDVYIDENGEMEVINGYGGPFKVSVSGATATISEGRIHNGYAPQHIIIPKTSQNVTITTGTLNAIWIVINQSGNSNYMVTNNINAGPTVSGEGTFYCMLVAVIGYEGALPIIQQCQYGDIVINGVWY